MSIRLEFTVGGGGGVVDRTQVSVVGTPNWSGGAHRAPEQGSISLI